MRAGRRQSLQQTNATGQLLQVTDRHGEGGGGISGCGSSFSFCLSSGQGEGGNLRGNRKW